MLLEDITQDIRGNLVFSQPRLLVQGPAVLIEKGKEPAKRLIRYHDLWIAPFHLVACEQLPTQVGNSAERYIRFASTIWPAQRLVEQRAQPAVPPGVGRARSCSRIGYTARRCSLPGWEVVRMPRGGTAQSRDHDTG